MYIIRISLLVFSLIQQNYCENIYQEFVVTMKSNSKDVFNLLNGSGFVVHREFPHMEGTYLLRSYHGNPLQARKELEQLLPYDKVIYLGEQRKLTRVRRTLDKEWVNQWALNDDVIPSMGVTDAWQLGYTGNGVKVAVVDDGIEAIHPDLTNNVDVMNSYDYYDDQTGASPSNDYDSHGTEIAGLTAAELNNSICIAGIAHKATLVSIRLLGENGTTDAEEALSLNHNLSTIDVYINSWGPFDKFGFDGPRLLTSRALQIGVEKGRNGKGVIYVWASGNGGRQDNCNGDGYANSIYTVTISSVDAGQRSPEYSEICAATLASTYSGDGKTNLYSTTLNSSCTGYIGGTSYSAPQAAAIVALALEANSNLTWRDIQHLIVETSMPYNLSDNMYNWTINGRGKRVSHLFGFGLMDAKGMVVKARDWTSVPPQQNCTSIIKDLDEWFSSYNNNGSTFLDEVNISDCAVRFIEHVTVMVNFTHDVNRGRVKINITSPFGTTSELLTERPLDSKVQAKNGTLNWTFMSVHFWGEHADGVWQIHLESSPCEVQWHSWSVAVYGTFDDPLSAMPTTVHNEEMKITTVQHNDYVVIIAVFIPVTIVLLFALIFVFVKKVKSSRQKFEIERPNMKVVGLTGF